MVVTDRFHCIINFHQNSKPRDGCWELTHLPVKMTPDSVVPLDFNRLYDKTLEVFLGGKNSPLIRIVHFSFYYEPYSLQCTGQKQGIIVQLIMIYHDVRNDCIGIIIYHTQTNSIFDLKSRCMHLNSSTPESYWWVSGMGQDWFRQWLVPCSSPSYCLNQF